MSSAGYIRATLQASKIILQMKYPYIKQGYEDGMGETWFAEYLPCKYPIIFQL